MLFKKKILSNFEEYICGVLLILMTILNFANVISRYFLHYSLSYTEEILMILFLWCTMLGTVVAFKKGLHLGLSVITDNLPEKLKIGFVAFSGLTSCAFMLFLINSAIEMIKTEIEYNQVTPVMGISEVYSTISIPIGCCLAIIRILIWSWNEIKQIREENIA